MSRNIRQNYTSSSGPRPRIKLTTKRRVSDTPSSSSLNLSGSEGLSDDEGYSGVDDVSESDDDDEEHVVAAEEEFLKKSARQPARPLIEDGNDADEEDDDDDDEPEEDDEVDGEDGSIEWPGLEEFHVYEPTGTYLASEELFTPVVERHVRFAGVPSSDSDSTDTDTDEEEEEEADQKFFPDIFIDQSVLDPGFRREIELEDCQSDSSGSFWDFHNASGDGAANDSGNELPSGNLDMTPMATPRGTPPPPNALKRLLEEEEEESEELDGYETDEEGDTTDEDIPEPLPRKILKRPACEELSSDSDSTPRAVRHVKGKPRVAKFNLERPDKKPIGVMDPATGKIIIFHPTSQDKAAANQPSEGAQDANALPPNLNELMSAMFSGAPLWDPLTLPAEAFFPFTSDALTGEDSEESDYYALMEDEDDDEDGLKLEDFIDFHNDGSDDEEESGQEWNGDPESSPVRPKTAASAASAPADSAPAEAHPLLSHFETNSSAVGAFRRNQVNQQLINSEIATQESLSFSAPYHYGTLRGIKSGSMETVTTPITPARRQKSNSLVGLNGIPDFSPGSPLNHVSQKRKTPSNDFSEPGMHKRHRSITDLEVLQV